MRTLARAFNIVETLSRIRGDNALMFGNIVGIIYRYSELFDALVNSERKTILAVALAGVFSKLDVFIAEIKFRFLLLKVHDGARNVNLGETDAPLTGESYLAGQVRGETTRRIVRGEDHAAVARKHQVKVVEIFHF